jgi:hypothetical protein
MFKYNYDVHEIMRRARRLFDGKLTYRKLLIALIITCLLFVYILSRFFFGVPKSQKGKSRV